VDARARPPFPTRRSSDLEMFCGRSRMPFVVIENSTTTATRAMKMPFLPRSAITWESHEVNLFSVGLMLPPTACDSVGVGEVGLDIAVPLLGPRLSGDVPWS